MAKRICYTVNWKTCGYSGGILMVLFWNIFIKHSRNDLLIAKLFCYLEVPYGWRVWKAIKIHRRLSAQNGANVFPQQSMSTLKCLKNRWTSVNDIEPSGNPSISTDKSQGSPLLMVEGQSLRYIYSRLTELIWFQER